MKKAFVAAAVVMLFATAASAQFTAELDLDGVVGNGPDFIEVMVSDYVDVDVWITGPNALLSFGMTICNYDGSLEYQGTTYFIPTGWTPIEPVPGVCFDVQATDFTFSNPMQLPALVATVTFHAAVDESIDDIIILQGGYLSAGFLSGNFSEMIGCTVQIGDIIGTEEASWGAVKGLFR